MQPRLPLPSLLQPTDLALLTLTGRSTGSSSLPPTTGKRHFSLIQGASEALNVTNPKAATSCWLCLAAGPPYYEGEAADGSITMTSDASLCPWGQSKKSLTLAEISGSGKCIGVVPPSHRHLCNHTWTIPASSRNQYLWPGNHYWWACSSRLTVLLRLFSISRKIFVC